MRATLVDASTSRPPPPPRASGLLRWWHRGAAALLADLRRHRCIAFLIATIWVLAAYRVLVDPTPRMPILFNWTPSLPYRVVIVDPLPRPLARGDLVVYAFAGDAGRAAYPGLWRQPLFKVIAGVPGDVVTVQGRNVFVNGVHVGLAKEQAFDRRPLAPIQPGVIPSGHYYVQGSSSDSFDSRYGSSGLVGAGDVVARVWPIL